jgi:CRP/FNR family cyclic AMP-dependent transcriptional regulator
MSTLREYPTPSLLESESIFAVPTRPATVPVLDADPELCEDLDPGTAARAARVARARSMHLEPGAWMPPDHHRMQGAIGLLVIDGLLSRCVRVGSDSSCELLGAGDLLRPWAEDAHQTVTQHVEYEVLAETHVAVLDREFARSIAPYPDIFTALTDRALRRCRTQAVLIATSHIKRVDVRLLALFWHLAERWGRVTPAGVVVPLKLTHSRLAALVGAQRPSVTTALKHMAARGVLTRNANADYVLGSTSRDELERLCLSNDARHLRLIDGSGQFMHGDAASA